jgi:alpha-N-arabinofuranosidase
MKMKMKMNPRHLLLLLPLFLLAGREAQSRPATLKSALKEKFHIGTALSVPQFTGKDTLSEQVARENFSAIVPENCMKSMYLQPSEGRFFFGEADRFVAWGEANGMWITGHCLVWHSQAPGWLFAGSRGKEASREELLARLKTHITTVVSRYKGRIRGWDVVNEAIMEDGSLRNSPLYRIIGQDFIDSAFVWAHRADPAAELYYNDYNMAEEGKRNAVVELVRRLKKHGIRIDAVGMQGHLHLDYPGLAEFEKSVEAFAAEGVQVMVTELDISVLPRAKANAGADVSLNFQYQQELNPFAQGLTGEAYSAWENRCTELFALLLRHSDAISRVTAWGVTDKDSWLNDWPVRGRTDYPLLFGRDYQPKPVVEKIIRMAAADKAQASTSRNTPLFTRFVYEGNDPVYKENPLSGGEFYIPILQGCYPDPSITRKGADYYLVCSSFAFFPGVPVFHSTDLVNWKQLGHVLDRPSQLKLDSARMSGGIYAPDIVYNPHRDMFYMITTQIAGGIGNMVVKTENPAGGWSDPVRLDIDGIDPSLFFDDDGKAYIVHNDAPGKALYPGHRVIKIREYDAEHDKVIPGTEKVIVDGGVDITKEPVWIEGPHIYKKNGRYYLMCAEGGTGGNHSEVIFAAEHATGPYIPAGQNPILTQRHLPGDRKNRVEWAGHADLVETPGGRYYGVFLAVRPNEANRVNTGRETFILPVDWSGEFPVFEGGLEAIPVKLKTPGGVKNRTGQDGFFPNGNFTFEDNFSAPVPDARWIGVRGPAGGFAELTGKGLSIHPYSTDIKEAVPVSALFYRQQHNSFTATATLDYIPASGNSLAGIVCYQKESFHYVFGITAHHGSYYLLLQRTDNGESTVIASEKIDPSGPVRLQVTADGDTYGFNYSFDNQTFKNVGGKVSGDILSTNKAGGFTGNLIGLYATSGNNIQPVTKIK